MTNNIDFAYVIQRKMTGEYIDSEGRKTLYLSEAYMTAIKAEAKDFMSKLGGANMYEINKVKITIF